MTYPAKPALLVLLALGACGPRVITMDGSETPAAGVSPRLALARVTSPASYTPYVEIRTADGTVRTGQLGLVAPEQAPLSPGGDLPLAARDTTRVLAGQLQAPGAIPLDCSFRVLNPPRGIAGGGAGGCFSADGNRIDFIY